MDTIKIFLHKVLRKFIYLISLLIKVKDNRIFFDSFLGKQYSCNPKYITEYLLKNYPNKYEIVWNLNNKQLNISSKIIKVKPYTLKYFYYFFSSKIFVTNLGIKSFLTKKNTQYRIETWHGGGAYKKVDLDIFKSRYRKFKSVLFGESIDCYISSCQKFSDNMSNAQMVRINKFFGFGMPRNDILFNSKLQEEIKNKILRKYCINNKKIVLYAPTWRDDKRKQAVESLNNVIQEINKISKNKEYILLCRSHHDGSLYTKSNDTKFINVTNYPDMQELLCAADILITDYSSCMWDFSLMYKPCFIYATDIDQYKQERDFYTPMSEWPFQIATNTDELISNILNFNQKEYVEKVKQHHKALGSFEDGRACERVCKLIEDIIEGKVQKE